MDHILLLNGTWKIDWLCEKPYTDFEEPHPQNDSAVSCPVPGYWEDMTDLFE